MEAAKGGMEFKMKILFIALLLVCALLLVSCAKEQSVISISEYSEKTERPHPAEKTVTLNISSQKIHFSSECRHVTRAKRENIRELARTGDTVRTLLSMGYSFCSDCAPQN